MLSNIGEDDELSQTEANHMLDGIGGSSNLDKALGAMGAMGMSEQNPDRQDRLQGGGRDRAESLDVYGDLDMTERGDIHMETLYANNVRWARKVSQKYPEFFENISRAQTPQFLWIGCADSRVAANEIVGLIPGELFVHRNVANVVAHTDFNCLAVMQYAVDVLKVKHIIVCGHYGCGGVLATLRKQRVGLVDNWLRHVDDVNQKHRTCLECYEQDEDGQAQAGNHLCELNVIEQALNVCKSTVVRDCWTRGQSLQVHGVCYGMKNGILKNLGINPAAWEEVEDQYEKAVESSGFLTKKK